MNLNEYEQLVFLSGVNRANIYKKSIEKVLIKEKLHCYDELEDKIEDILPKYERGGKEEEFGAQSHKTVLASLKKIKDFKDGPKINIKSSGQNKMSIQELNDYLSIFIKFLGEYYDPEEVFVDSMTPGCFDIVIDFLKPFLNAIVIKKLLKIFGVEVETYKNIVIRTKTSRKKLMNLFNLELCDIERREITIKIFKITIQVIIED